MVKTAWQFSHTIKSLWWLPVTQEWSSKTAGSETLIEPSKTAADNTFIFILLSFEENKAWYYMWILCLAEDSYEISNLIFSEKQWKTRTVRKSDYTPALALPKHMAGIFDKKCWEKEKYREEQKGECPFSIPRRNLSLWTCIPQLKFLSQTVVKISWMKNLERKKKEPI